ncbi:MAG: hypothetical protein NPINA01_20870 [Nitrospinaceae bacterium]|nr:MAG: hypothetical protein NPINA01_20870 [Nitrospinaceae bacterium]
MCKFSGKILTFAVLALFLNVGIAVADPANSDWNNSWGFPSPFEKANLLDQAIAIELVEEDGFSNKTNFYNSYSDVVAIGNQVNIEGNDNNVGANNDGNVAAQNNGDDINQEAGDDFNSQNAGDDINNNQNAGDDINNNF